MTLDELRRWLAEAPEGPAPEALVRAASMAAHGNAAGALRLVQDLKTVEGLRLEKYDKTNVTTPGVEGLRPFETVRMTFEDGRLVASQIETVTEEGGD